MHIQLVALDLDDTLLNRERTISPRTCQTIRKAVEKGVTVTIATGRMYCSALPYARQLELDVPLITYNGAMIKRGLSGETLFHRPIEEDTAAEILALFRRKGWYIQTYLDDTLYIAERNEKAELYKQISGIEPVFVGNELYHLKGSPTKMLTIAEGEELAEIRRTVLAEFAGRVVGTNSKANFLEIMHPEANKGRALASLARQLGVKQEEVMSIGDSNNDLDMIRYAGFGVAMGNAAAQVKAQAQAVTAANDADGVAEAIEKYVLGSR